MDTVPIVSQEEFDRARKMEEKMLALPPDSGVLFVGVVVEVRHARQTIYELGSAKPVVQEGERSVRYRMVLGLSRDYSEQLADPLARVTLGELAVGVDLVVDGHRGCVRLSA